MTPICLPPKSAPAPVPAPARAGRALASVIKGLRAGLLGLSCSLAGLSLVSCETTDTAARDSEPIRHSDPIRVEPPANRRTGVGDKVKVAEPRFKVVQPNVVVPEEDTGRPRRSKTRHPDSPRSGVESVRPAERRDRTRVIRDPYTGVIPIDTIDANKGGNVTTRRR